MEDHIARHDYHLPKIYVKYDFFNSTGYKQKTMREYDVRCPQLHRTADSQPPNGKLNFT